MSEYQGLEENSPELYATEVIKCLTQMREQRQRLSAEIGGINEEKRKLQASVRQLTSRLAKLNYKLAQKTHFDNELQKTIENAEKAYAKLVENSHTIYESIKHTKDALLEQSNITEEYQVSPNLANQEPTVNTTSVVSKAKKPLASKPASPTEKP